MPPRDVDKRAPSRHLISSIPKSNLLIWLLVRLGLQGIVVAYEDALGHVVVQLSP